MKFAHRSIRNAVDTVAELQNAWPVRGEGREAMGESVVKLRSGGKLYSGRGISTDIIGASVHAYLNAINKIGYEEAANA